MISLTVIAYVALGLIAVGVLALTAVKPGKKALEHHRKMLNLEEALSNPDTVAIIQKMLREPPVRDPMTPGQRRKNKKYALLRAQLQQAVPDEKTRKIIYTIILLKQNRVKK